MAHDPQSATLAVPATHASVSSLPWVRTACAMLLLVLATALAAQVRIPLPFTPVPITLQTMVVTLGALILGGYRGAAAQAIYLALGSFALPLFAGAGLKPYLLGPTGGYLLGFVAASLILGQVASRARQRSFVSILAWVFVADAVLLSMGVVQLKMWMQASWPQALLMGLYPFLPGNLIKSCAAAAAYHRLQGWSRRQF